MKACRGCQLAAKAPPGKFQPWSKTDVPWTRLRIDSTSKWSLLRDNRGQILQVTGNLQI